MHDALRRQFETERFARVHEPVLGELPEIPIATHEAAHHAVLHLLHPPQLGRAAEELHDRDLIYAFVLVSTTPKREAPIFYLVPARYVAEYVRWSHHRHLQVVRRQRNPDSPMRKFRIPVATPDLEAVPRSWKPMPWRRWREDWSVFGPPAT